MNDNSVIATVLFSVVVLIVVFVVIRAFWLWYWKIDEQVALLKQIRDRLDRLGGAGSVAAVGLSSAPATSTPISSGVETSGGGNKLRCPSCGQFVRPLNVEQGKVCPYDATVIVPSGAQAADECADPDVWQSDRAADGSTGPEPTGRQQQRRDRARERAGAERPGVGEDVGGTSA
ncbi:MAG TPA: hypothetical protein VFX49_13880 [Chloroflexota bacterium]|nr:hypothetical protein [Chloroflexota bacterium]